MRQLIWPILAVVLVACVTVPSCSKRTEDTLGAWAEIVRKFLGPFAQRADASETSGKATQGDSLEAPNSSWYERRTSPWREQRQLPSWPPRFDDATSQNTGVALAESSRNTDSAPPPMANHVGGDAHQLYPATARPEFLLPTGRLVTVIDPMQAEAVPLASQVTDDGANLPSVQARLSPRTNPPPVFPSVETWQVPSDDGQSRQVNLASQQEVVVTDESPLKWSEGPALQAAAAKVERGSSVGSEVCEQVAVLAKVGGDVILAGEILGAVNEILLSYQDKVPPSVLEQYKRDLMRRLLMQRVEMKLVYQDAKRHLPAEAVEHFEKEVSKLFDEKELPERLKKMGLNSPQEFDARLKKLGSSLAHEKRAFVEAVIAREWLRQQTEREANPLATASPEELLAYYQTHIQEFEKPGWVEWQQITVKKDRGRSPSEAAARAAEARDRVLKGEPFEDVARAMSEGPTASSGGWRERTYRGSLRSKAIEDVLFSLPVGSISPIIEDEQGFHIVRVVRREETQRIPFSEAQVTIRDKLAQERRQQMTREWLRKLSQEIPVWTIYDQSGSPSDSVLR